MMSRRNTNIWEYEKSLFLQLFEVIHSTDMICKCLAQFPVRLVQKRKFCSLALQHRT